jgi:hypothetical protein
MTTHSRTASSLAVAVALTLGAGTPGALAESPQQMYGPPGRPNQEKQLIAPPQASAPATIVRVSAPSGGFDWGDAGIGAIGGLAVSIIGVGGALALSQRRGHPGQSDLAR